MLLLNCGSVPFHLGQNNLSFVVKVRHPPGREARSWLQITWIATEGTLTHATSLLTSSLFILFSKIFPPYAYLCLCMYIPDLQRCLATIYWKSETLLRRGNQAKETKIFCQVWPIHNPHYSHATGRRRSVCKRKAMVNLRMRTRPLLCHRQLITFPISAGTWSRVFGKQLRAKFLASSLSISEVFSRRDDTSTSLTRCLKHKPYIHRQQLNILLISASGNCPYWSSPKHDVQN